ncbi:hypothetical protein ABFS83_04G224000 [Erythranthe nasuta]
MSRCFPFPPPGYEIKASPDNVNLISKEKHKPKKHKEKKDKDKKERSEKKEKKDRSEGKHKDDRKQKKKDKHERKTEMCVPNDSKSADGMQDYRILVELGKRVRNDDGATTDNRTLGKIAVVEQKHELMANGHTPKVEANGSRNGFHGKFCGDGIEKRNELKEKKENGIKNEDRDKKREEKKRKKERKKEKKMEKEKKQTKVKESSKENVKQTENNGNALYNNNNNNNNNPSDHLKESLDGRVNIPKQEKRAMNGFLHDNGFRPNTPTLRAVVEKVSPVTNQKIDVITNHVEKGAVVTNQKIDVITNHVEKGAVVTNQKIDVITNHVEKGAVVTNQKIDVITNHVEIGAVVTNQKIDGVITNGKINGKLSSSQLVVENNISTSHNGKAGSNNHAKSNGNSTKPTNVKPNSGPVVENGRKLDNGALDGKTSMSSRPLSVSVKARKEKKVKKPNNHPDLKYLSQILTVPKVDPPRFDDQDWLFGYKAKRPKLGSESTHKHVWAEAIELGAADIIALPYVIPY